MPNIAEFTGKYNNLARMNRFKVGMAGSVGDIEFFAKGANLPASTVPAMDVQYQGRILKLDGDRTYEAFEMTVYGDPAMNIRRQLERIQEVYNQPIENTGEFNPFQMQVDLMDRRGATIMSYEMHGCIISTISSVALDWGTNDSPLEFSVTVDYNYHIST